MSFRQKLLGFTGGMMALFGVCMNVLGSTTVSLQEATAALNAAVSLNASAGVPMWGSIFIMMCGLVNIGSAFEKKKKRRPYDMMPFSFGVVLANMIAIITAAIIIGLLSWAMYNPWLNNTTVSATVIGVYSNIIIMASMVIIMAFMALFIDCCMGSFMGFGMPFMPPYDQRESPYDTYGRSGPPAIYKP